MLSVKPDSCIFPIRPPLRFHYQMELDRITASLPVLRNWLLKRFGQNYTKEGFFVAFRKV